MKLNRKLTVSLSAIALALGLASGTVAALEEEDLPPYGYGPGYGMGPGMMGPGYGGPGMMGPGYGMGPGMMGPGYGMGPGMMGPGYGMGQGMMGPGMMGPGMGPGMMGPGYGHGYGRGQGYMGGIWALDLSDEQRKKIQDIMQEEQKARFEHMGRMQSKYQELYRLYDQEKPDPDAIGTAYDEIAKERRSAIQARVRTQNRIVDVLTDEQRKQLQQYRKGWR